MITPVFLEHTNSSPLATLTKLSGFLPAAKRQNTQKSIMRFVTFALYSLKVNVINMLVAGQRSSSLNLNYLHSSTVQTPSVATPHDDEIPDHCFASNITDLPLL